jgi:hypothetical protein
MHSAGCTLHSIAHHDTPLLNACRSATGDEVLATMATVGFTEDGKAKPFPAVLVFTGVQSRRENVESL